MRRSKVVYLLAAFCPLALADVQFTVPAAGGSIAGGTAMTVTWKDSGAAPSISDLTAYQLFLMSGSNASPQQLLAFTLANGGLFSGGNTISVTVPVGTGGTGTNA